MYFPYSTTALCAVQNSTKHVLQACVAELYSLRTNKLVQCFIFSENLTPLNISIFLREKAANKHITLTMSFYIF